jgi:sortase A
MRGMTEPPAPPIDSGPRRMDRHRARRQGRFVRRLADVLLIAGGLLLAYPFWSAGYAQVQQQRLGSAYEEQAAAFAGSVGGYTDFDSPQRVVPEEQVVARLAALYKEQLRPGDPIGHLKIPAIGVNRIVQQGVSGRASLSPEGDRDLLRSGPVHYGITPLPGAGEPFAVAGHRTTFGAPFNRLDRLKKGDQIYMETPYAKFRFSVAKITVVTPDDVSVLQDRGYALVLTTCTPMYSATHRLIVWAKLDYTVPATADR